MATKTKDRVLDMLKASGSKYLSGQEMAEGLYVTRAAVWKAIKALQEEGYEIDAVNNRGYRLVEHDVLPDRERIVEYILEQDRKHNMNVDGPVRIFVYDEVESTNDTAREYAQAHPGEFAVMIAGKQSKGRGRRGRSFFSPANTGLYMSFILYPDNDLDKVELCTCMMAVALCRAIEEITSVKVDIKWVNDICLDDKKIAGILTEAVTSLEDGCISYVIVGVGINIYEPYGGFPLEIKKDAGVLLDAVNDEEVINKLAARTIFNFYRIHHMEEHDYFLDEYIRRSMLVGKYIKIEQYTPKDEKKGNEYAYVTGIDDECHLLVRYDDGREVALSSGEVSVARY